MPVCSKSVSLSYDFTGNVAQLILTMHCLSWYIPRLLLHGFYKLFVELVHLESIFQGTINQRNDTLLLALFPRGLCCVVLTQVEKVRDLH